jgi:hypothetical protein
VIFTFSKHLVQRYIAFLTTVSPGVATFVQNSIQKQKEALFADQSKIETGKRPIISVIWEYCIGAMVLYFVVSFLNSIVRNHLKAKVLKSD